MPFYRKSMKIAIICDVIYPFSIGGSEKRNYEFARFLVKRGHEVHLYGFKLWKGNSKIILDGIDIHGIIPTKEVYSSENKRSALQLIRLAIKTLQELSKEKYDIIEVTSYNFFNCYASSIYSATKKVPMVLMWQQYFGDYLLDYFNKAEGTLAKILESGTKHLTRFHLASYDYVKKELVKEGIKEINIKIIPNGVNTKKAELIRGREKTHDLLFVGRLNFQKNLELLIKAVAVLKKEFPNINVGVIGSGRDELKLKAMIKKLQLKDNFHFYGKIIIEEEIFRIMKESKIFVLPSKLEGFSLAVLEAYACGLPVITSNSKHNQNRHLAKEDSLVFEHTKESCAETIRRLLRNKKLIKKIQNTELKKIKKYDWEVLGKEVEDYYSKVIREYNK